MEVWVVYNNAGIHGVYTTERRAQSMQEVMARHDGATLMIEKCNLNQQHSVSHILEHFNEE